ATVRRYPFSPSLVFLFFLTCRRPPRPPLFPYTTLFRSSDGCTCPRSPQPNAAGAPSGASRDPRFARPWSCFGAGRCGGGGPGGGPPAAPPPPAPAPPAPPPPPPPTPPPPPAPPPPPPPPPPPHPPPPP